MKHLVILTFVNATCFLFAPLQAQETLPKKLTLSDCIRYAIKNNLDVQRSTIQSEASYVNAMQSRENLLPAFNASIIHGVNEGRNIDPYTNTYVNQQVGFANQEVNGSLVLFNGLAMQSLIRQNTFAFEAAKTKEQQIKDNVSLNVVLIYLQVLTNMDLLALSSTQAETTRKQLSRSETLHSAGSINPSTYYDLKGQLMNDELQVATNKNIVENSKIAMAQLLNSSYNKDLELETIPMDAFILNDVTNPEQLYKTAEQHLAMIKTADLNVKVASMGIRYARSGYYPSLYLRGALLSNYSSRAKDIQDHPVGYKDQVKNNLGKTLNISLVIPIFNNLKTHNAVSLAKLAQQETQLTAETTRKQLQQLTAQAYLNMVTAKEKWQLLNEQVLAFSESFKSAEVRFNLGVINTTDYLISKNNLEKSKINLVISGYDFILRKKIVDFYEGKGLE